MPLELTGSRPLGVHVANKTLCSKGHFGGLDTPGFVYDTASFAETREHVEYPRPPVELAATERTLAVPETGEKVSKRSLDVHN